jgi:hypothetical protein
MRKLLAVAACTAAIGIFGACGSNSSGGSTPDAATTGDANGADAVGGAANAVDGCKSIVKLTCDKIFKCFSKEELDLLKNEFGLNTADCETKLNAECIPEKANCKAGETYRPDMGQQCIDLFKEYTCDDIRDPNTPDPAACDQRCMK